MMKKIKLILNLIFEIITFIITLYMISSFMISFQSDIRIGIVMVINICHISMFYNIFKKQYGKNKAILMTLFSLIMLIFIVYEFGYFKVSNELSYF